jgi:hypothetical protein
MLLPALLAVMALMGGMVMFFHATTREVSIAATGRAKATLRKLSGFTVVLNDVERADEAADDSDA